MSQYYIREVAGDKGPFSIQELRDLYKSGYINEESLIREIGGFDWRPLEQCREFPPFREDIGGQSSALRPLNLIEYLSDFGFQHLDPVKFEEFVMKIFEAFGLAGKLTPVTGDDGIDIELFSTDGKKAIAQCKRYNADQTIGVRDIRELLGAMVHSNSAHGFFVTTSTFTDQAKDFAKGKNLLLVDGPKLKKLFLLAVDAERDSSFTDDQYFDPINWIVAHVMKMSA